MMHVVVLGDDIYSLVFRSYHKESAETMEINEHDQALAVGGAFWAFSIQMKNFGVFSCIFYDENDTKEVDVPKNEYILLVRMMTMSVMHLSLEPKLRLSLNMMKFTINHPQEFKQLFPAFSVGLASFTAILALEILSAFYFCMFGNSIKVMIKLLGIGFISDVG
jgi:hypothetical protein